MTDLLPEERYAGLTDQLPRFDHSPFGRRRRDLRAGVTAVLRVKDEAAWLPHSLPPLLRSVHAVLLVDNGSTDGTSDVARGVAAGLGAADRLKVLNYPFTLSRCGPEHLATPSGSPHSLAHFNNWAFSHVQTAYAMKWDGDMVLTPEGEHLVEAFGWQVGRREVVLRVPRHPLYVVNDRSAYLDVDAVNVENFGHPILPGYAYVKAFEWEVLKFPPGTPQFTLPPSTCVELKHLDEDEFDHWTDPSAFEDSARTSRKRRELAVFHAAAAGELEQFRGLIRIDSPDGVSVVEHVARGELLPHLSTRITVDAGS